MKWISVEDRLPEKGQVLLTNNPTALDANGMMSHIWIGFLITACEPEITGKYVSYDGRNNLIHGITHWQPLPEPPESDNE